MKKIVVAFHDDIIRDSCFETLKNSGFEVFGAENGKAVVDLVKAKKPDLVLLDVNLSGISGFEVMKKIKAEEDLKKIPVIIFGHFEDPIERLKAMDLGAIDYIAFSAADPIKIANKARIVLGQQRGYSIKVSEKDKNLLSLLKDIGYEDNFICKKCGSLKELFLIRNLECGKNSFLVSFSCPNNCI